MKAHNPTNPNRWCMHLNIAGEQFTVLFDGEKVYDYWFPDDEIVGFHARCGHVFTGEQIAQVCRSKMENMSVMRHKQTGEWVAI